MVETESAGAVGLQGFEDAANGGRQEDQAFYGGKRRVPPRRNCTNVLTRSDNGIRAYHHANHEGQHQQPVDGKTEMLEAESLHVK